ncbi:hypothetical protein Tco_1186790 [Tanacetum coccineum]
MAFNTSKFFFGTFWICISIILKLQGQRSKDKDDGDETRNGRHLEDHAESIDSGFARFNTIITSLKELDEGFSSKNYVRKFLKDSEIYKGKKERVKSITLKAKKGSSDDETSTFKSDDEEYAMVIRNFKKFFKRKGRFVRQPREEKKSFRQRDDKKGKSDRK